MTARHLDRQLPVDARVEALLAEMTIEEKAGQMFHTMGIVGRGGTIAGQIPGLSLPPLTELIGERSMTHFNITGDGDAATLATWHNAVQDLALGTRLQIPVTISTNPRHAFTRNIGTATATTAFSTWPETLGLAALDDADLVEEFCEIVRSDYLAVGMRVALHPQLDLATEPRWARILTTFGEDGAIVGRLATAYVRGLHAGELGPDSVAAMIKHFPGGGPLRDGEDSHFASGKVQEYPVGNFELHLAPFVEALAAGATQVMPSYGMPVGTEYDEVACGFNRSILTTLLRERLGFDGIICTDWGLVTDDVLLGQVLPARAWGVEHLTEIERVRAIVDAGADQLGGEHCTELLVELVRRGEVSEERIDQSVRRLLREKFVLGLFDQRQVDVDAATARAGTPAQRAAGMRAQSRAVTVLTNDPLSDGRPVLPLPAGCRVHCVGLDPAALAEVGGLVPVDAPADADVTIVRVDAPHEPRPGGFESRFHSGSLDFPDDELQRLLTLADAGPTVIVVHLERPAILTALVDRATALVAEFGCSDQALIDALSGRVPPAGRLPVELPRSMATVIASPTDAPCATADPLFPIRHGLTI